MPRRVAAALGVLALTFASSPLQAADVGEGRKIADAWCASCHLTSDAKGGADTAPRFVDIARNRAIDRKVLSGVLADPHPAMPRLDLSHSQLEDLAAYIRSLNPDGDSTK